MPHPVIGRRHSKVSAKCRGEVTMARKSKIESKPGDVFAMRQLKQRPVHAQLKLVTIERNSFHPTEFLGEIDTAYTDFAGDRVETQSLAFPGMEQQFRIGEQAWVSRRRLRLGAEGFGQRC